MCSLIIFLFSNVLNNIVKYGTIVFIAAYFIPEELAIYQKQLLIITYIQLLFFGVSNYINREVPRLESKNKKLQIKLLISSIYAYRNILILFLTGLAIVYLIVINNYRVAIYIISAAVSLLLSLQLTVYRGLNKFNKLSSFLLIANVVSIFCIYIASKLQNIDMVLFSFIISTLVTLFLVEQKLFLLTFKSLKLRSSILVSMMKKGKYLAINGLLFSLLVNVDKLLLALFFTDKSLGLYSFINAFTSFSLLVIMLITQFYFPKLIKMSYNTRIDILKKLTLFIFIFSVFFIGASYTILPMIVKEYFMNYSSSLDYLSISLIISTLVGAIGYIGLYFNLSYKEKNYTKLLIFILGQIVLYNTIFIVLNFSSEWMVLDSIVLAIGLSFVIQIVIRYPKFSRGIK